jgi:hypothetical protein
MGRKVSGPGEAGWRDCRTDKSIDTETHSFARRMGFFVCVWSRVKRSRGVRAFVRILSCHLVRGDIGRGGNHGKTNVKKDRCVGV